MSEGVLEEQGAGEVRQQTTTVQPPEPLYPFVKHFRSFPHENHVYGYFQTRSKRTWATYVTETFNHKSFFNDSNSFGVYSKLTQRETEKYETLTGEPHPGVPTTIIIVQTETEYETHINEHCATGLKPLKETVYVNTNPSSPYFFAVGFYETESFTHECPTGVETIKLSILVDNPGRAERIVFVMKLNETSPPT